MDFLANLFGYLLNFIYEIVNNYGIAILIFSVIIRIILLPVSIKQQRTMKKTAKIQGKMKQLQFKYKNNPEQLNKETMELYKSEKMSPFSGCLSAIIQIILLLAVFLMVQSPLTFMKKVDTTIIEQYKSEIAEKNSEDTNNRNMYPEIQIIREKGSTDERVYINMEFLGLDLSSVPISNLNDPKVYVIPVLYVISSFISIKLSTNLTQQAKKKEEGKDEEDKPSELDAVASANKSMTYIMPIMSVSIAMIAPLGLALYWFVSNVLMIGERIVLTKYFDKKEEEENG